MSSVYFLHFVNHVPNHNFIKSNNYMQVVASYFPLSQCIEGLKVLVQSLFGATFHSIPLASGESWDPQVLKLALHHPEEVFE